MAAAPMMGSIADWVKEPRSWMNPHYTEAKRHWAPAYLVRAYSFRMIVTIGHQLVTAD